MKKIAIALLTAVLMVVAICPVSAQDSTVTSIVFPNDSAVAEQNLSVSGYGDKESGYAASTVGGRLFASVSGTDLRKLEWSKGEYAEVGMQPVMTGGTKNPWGVGAHIELRLSTVGYTDLTFSAKLGATNKGPRDYKLQYSTDGGNFTDVAGAFFTVTTNKTMFAAFDNVVLPAAVNDCDEVYIRITVASNMMVNGTAGLVGSTGGETAINNVIVSGTPLAADTTVTTTTPTAAEDTDMTTSVEATVATSTAAKTTTVKELPMNADTGENRATVFVTAIMATAMCIIAATALRHSRKRAKR